MAGHKPIVVTRKTAFRPSDNGDVLADVGHRSLGQVDHGGDIGHSPVLYGGGLERHDGAATHCDDVGERGRARGAVHSLHPEAHLGGRCG